MSVIKCLKVLLCNTAHYSTLWFFMSTPRVTKTPQIPPKSPQRHINTPKVLDIHCQASYNNSITLRRPTHVGCTLSGTEAKV